MHDNNAFAADTEVPPARIHDVQLVAFLLAHIAEPQLIGVEKLYDLAFKPHKRHFGFQVSVNLESDRIRRSSSTVRNLIMSDEMLSPLIGSPLRVENREELEEFLTRPDAAQVVETASFEEVFFTIKNIGLADSMDLLPLVSSKQVRGFIDLDCWRKDTFVRKPFMEWIRAFIQAGPEDTVRALSGIGIRLLRYF